MVITFCGHSKYVKRETDEKTVLDFLEGKVGDAPIAFYLGGYGSFDSFGYSCAKKFKAKHPDTKLIFITPYITEQFQKKYNMYDKDKYDYVIYPELENVPLRYAILHRNKWIAEQADVMIAYISHEFGGAYMTYRHAKRKGKEIFNLYLRIVE